MPEVFSQSYPYFERGLPLRSADLNNLVRYLESEDRRTRTLLIGSGCMYGLGIHLDLSNGKCKIILEKGVGVTSLGYLLAIENPDDIKKEYTFGSLDSNSGLTTLDFKDSAAEVVFDGSVSVSDEENLTNTSVLSIGGDGIPVLELLAGYNVVLLYSLSGDRSVAGCQNCDKTLLAKSEIRLLLMLDGDLEKVYTSINRANANCSVGDSTQFLSADYPFMPRFKISKDTGGYDQMAFVSDYRAACTKGLESIRSALENLNANVTVQKLFNSTLPVEKLDDLTALLSNGTFLNNIQYAYSYIRDLIRTYEELAETPFGEVINFLPDQNCFPRHLVLGKIVAKGNTLQIETGQRTPLYRPPFTSAEDENLKQAKFLYERLKIQLENIQLTKLPNEGVRITPGAAVSALLGRQAVPYYYNIDLVRPKWNFANSQTGRHKSVPGYLRSGNVPPFNEPLFHQTDFDRADFYRIEGHIGKKLTELKAIKLDHDGNLLDSEFHQLRKSRNLPFQVKLCALDNNSNLNKMPMLALAAYCDKNPGIEHQGGVPKGGTFLLVVEQREGADGAQIEHYVVGDFCLPYYDCCKKDRQAPPIAEFIVESPNVFEIVRDGNNVIVYVFTVPDNESDVHIFFKNISENADAYSWEVSGKSPRTLPATDLAFDEVFQFSDDDYQVKLIATRDDLSDDTVKKIRFVVAKEPIVPVVAEFIVESPNDFTMTVEKDAAGKEFEVYTFERPEQGDLARHIFFKSVSENADTFEWKVKGKTVTKNKEAAFNDVFDFAKKEFYEVSLTASRAGQPPHVVAKIVRLEKAPVTVNANFEYNGKGQQFVDFAEVSPATYKGKATEKVTMGLQHLDFDSLATIWDNTSSLNADLFHWKVYRANETKSFAEQKMNSHASFNLQLEQKELSVTKTTSFIIELNATNNASGATDQKNVLLDILPPPSVLVVKPATELIAGSIPVAEFKETEEKTKPKSKQKPAATDSSGDAKTALAPPANIIQNLRTRHRDYRSNITGVGKENALLAKTKGFKNALAFLDSGDDVDMLGKSFKDLALQFIRNIKLEGGLPDEVYQNLLKNLLFFCFDKLSFLQTAGLSANIKKTLGEVFDRMKAEKTFPSLPALRSEWKSTEVRTADNTSVVAQLDALFG